MKVRLSIIVIGFLFFSWTTHAQYTSRLGRFQVDQKKGCAPLTLTITIVAPFVCNAGSPCDMDYEGKNQPQSLVFTHTYATPGTYTLSVLFQSASPPTDDIVIEVLPNIQPTFDLYTCGNNEVSVKVTDTNYNQYVIDYNDGTVKVVPSGSFAVDRHIYATSGNKTVTVRGRYLSASDNCNAMSKPFTAMASISPPVIQQLTLLSTTQVKLDFTSLPNIQYRLEIGVNNTTNFQFLQMVYNVNTVTIANLLTDQNYYAFRLGAFDPCANTTVYSPVIISADLDVLVQNSQNHLSWATSSLGAIGFDLLRDAQPYAALAAGQTVYDDMGVVCKTNYCYQLITRYANGASSVSLSKCGTAQSTTPPVSIEDITTSIGAGATVAWLPPLGFTPVTYDVLRGTGGAFSLLAQTAVPQYDDPTYTVDAAYCYKVTYQDVCGNVSVSSAPSCPVVLSGTVQKDNAITLSWTAYTGWKSGVSYYIVEKYTLQGTLLQTFNTGTTLTLFDNSPDPSNQAYRYVVKAMPADPALPSAVSNAITVIKKPNLYYPTAFTPNGDNLNDVFNVFGQYIVEFNMDIFNRWGELIFSSSGLGQGWDGTYLGVPLPEGMYVFRARLTDMMGRSTEEMGSVFLIKKK